ncbi:MAG: glutamate racemase [Planctomycetota bacterium]
MRSRWLTGFRYVIALAAPILLGFVATVGPDSAAGADAPGKAVAPAVSAFRERAAQDAREAFRRHAAVARAEYPVGVFDSGTGGLAVLEAILATDTVDNRTGRASQTGDGSPDFELESFVFLADQANMPYGDYAGAGKVELLEDLITGDAAFLLGTRYFSAADAPQPHDDKVPVKAIVIACNTATAYGKDDVERLISAAGLDIQVIGVIDAGAKGAVDVFADGTAGTIGVFATCGTVASEAYPRAIRREIDGRGLQQRIEVVQQGAHGLASAIDGDRDYLVAQPAGGLPRGDYQGPGIGHPIAPVDCSLLRRYGFDFSQSRMLFTGTLERPTLLQLNSVDNYIAYHVVALLETLRSKPDAPPLRAIVLGCTHFPYYTEQFRNQLERLREYREDGQYIYRNYLAPRVEVIDPAVRAAEELMAALVARKEADRSVEDPFKATRGEFYLTQASADCPPAAINEQGGFAHDYKYGRSRDHVGEDFLVVPLQPKHLDAATAGRLRQQLPRCWRLMQDFEKNSQKTRSTTTPR